MKSKKLINMSNPTIDPMEKQQHILYTYTQDTIYSGLRKQFVIIHWRNVSIRSVH